MTQTPVPLEQIALRGRYIRLEPLTAHHAEGLLAAASADPQLYRWSAVPTTRSDIVQYIETALSWRREGSSLPFATVRQADDVVLGSTRFFLFEHWAWPAHHPRHGNSAPDACELGYTWLGREGVRTAANTEAKLLMLTFAFETWRVLRVCLHTDVRNERSRNAMLRIGAQFEGVLRAHRLAVDNTPRDSARYSIVESQWPSVRAHLLEMMGRYDAAAASS